MDSKLVLLTPKEAAKLLNTTEASLATWRCRKTVQIPYIKIGRAIRYDLRDLEAFIERQKIDN